MDDASNQAPISYWDEVRNPIAFSQVSPKSRLEYWWTCGRPNHSFEIAAILMFDAPGCRVCSAKIAVAGENDLATTHPELLDSWDYQTNEPLMPSMVTSRMGKKVAWVCSKGHSWKVAICDRTNVNRNGIPSGCPYCSNKKVLKGFNDLASKFPKVAKEWDFNGNEGVRPEQVTFGTPKSFKWVCKLGHGFESRVVDRTKRGIQCPTCMNQKLQVGFNDLKTTHPKLAGEWHPVLNGDRTPTDVQGGSGGKAWWLCDLGHAFEAEIRQRKNKGTGCTVCSNMQVLEGFNDLVTTHPQIAAEWDWERNKGQKPSDFIAGNRLKFWWKCTVCSESWSASLSNRTHRNSGCPQCSPGGFDMTKPGILYFIGNDRLGARKIGITNLSSKQNRTRAFEAMGWRVIKDWKNSRGDLILNVETHILRKIRLDYQLPPFLGPAEMGKLGGWSETFAADAVADSEIVNLAEAELARLEERPN